MGTTLNMVSQPAVYNSDVTPQGNKRYRFSPVTREEIDKLRVNVYSYSYNLSFYPYRKVQNILLTAGDVMKEIPRFNTKNRRFLFR